MHVCMHLAFTVKSKPLYYSAFQTFRKSSYS